MILFLNVNFFISVNKILLNFKSLYSRDYFGCLKINQLLVIIPLFTLIIASKPVLSF